MCGGAVPGAAVDAWPQAETRELVVERLRLDEATAAAGTAGPAGASDIDTDDEAAEEAEYDSWKARELARIGSEREEREKEARELAERERLKTMTDEERRQWERENPKVSARVKGSGYLWERDHVMVRPL